MDQKVCSDSWLNNSDSEVTEFKPSQRSQSIKRETRKYFSKYSHSYSDPNIWTLHRSHLQMIKTRSIHIFVGALHLLFSVVLQLFKPFIWHQIKLLPAVLWPIAKVDQINGTTLKWFKQQQQMIKRKRKLCSWEKRLSKSNRGLSKSSIAFVRWPQRVSERSLKKSGYPRF